MTRSRNENRLFVWVNESGGSVQGEIFAFPAKEDGSIPIPPLQFRRSESNLLIQRQNTVG